MGTDQRFDDFYAATVAAVVRQVFALTGNLQTAQDVAQEAYARAWNRWGRLAGYDEPEAWVRTVAHRLAISDWRRRVNRAAAHRRHGVTAEVSSRSPSPDAVAVAVALAVLPANQRRAVVLHYLADLSVADVAREMNAPLGSVKGWLSRGRSALQPLLDDGYRTTNRGQR